MRSFVDVSYLDTHAGAAAGGLGCDFDVSALGNPSDMIVRVTVFEVTSEAGPTFAPPVDPGIFPTDVTANEDVIRSGSRSGARQRSRRRRRLSSRRGRSRRARQETQGQFLTNVAIGS